MINWFDMPAEGLSNGGQFEVKELEVTENGTYETKGEMYNKVTVNVEGGGGETWNTVFDGSVTTEASDFGAFGEIQYESLIDADKIKVTFNGTEYECPKMSAPAGNAYGGIGETGPDFSEYPFTILSAENQETVSTTIYTQTAGTYTLKIEEPQSGGSSDFSTAKVTLTNKTPFELTLAHIDNTTGISPQMGQSGEYEVVLYKGKAEGIFMSPSGNLSVTGNITYNNGELVITGDGAITISK